MNYSRIITVSPNTGKKLKQLGFLPPVSVVPSGVDADFIKNVAGKKTGISIVFVGRLVKYKNVDVLVNAFAAVQKKFPGARLDIIGTGPTEMELKFLAQKLGLNIKFHGFVSETEKIRIIKSASLLVNPSSVEGLGLILIESMACGTPVVAKRLDTYFFCTPRNSILYRDDFTLGKLLVDTLGSKKLMQSLAKGGLETSKEYSWDVTAGKVEKIYEALV